jgi:SAM-dependent methyltransferase
MTGSSENTPWVLGRGAFWLEHVRVRQRIFQKISGDPKKDAYLFLIDFLKKHGVQLPLERALTIGCGAGNIERGVAKYHLVSIHDACDISKEAITRARELAKLEGLSHINYFVADANKMKLEPDKYDLVIGQHSFHHLVALEDIYAQIARSLKRTGFLFLNEFIGPTRFQWTDRQLEVVNAILRILPAKYRRTKTGRLKERVERPSVAKMLVLDPSEAARSSELISTLYRYFDIVERRDYGGTLLHTLLADIAVNFTHDSLDEELLDIIFRLEDVLLATGDLQSDFAVIIAKKKEEDSGQ